MLPYLLLIPAIFGSVAQNSLSGVYNRRVERTNPYVFTSLISLSVAGIALALNGFRFVFDFTTFLYAIFFGAAYSLCFIFQVFAVKKGGVALTSLILSYSLILPTVFGIVAYRNPTGVFFWLGLAALFVSVFLIRGKRKGKDAGAPRSWAALVFVAFTANGICSILQTHQQSVCNGNYKSEFMIMAMALVFAVNTTASFVSDRKSILPVLKKGWYLGVLCGAANAVLNFSVMFLVGSDLRVNVIFPLLSVGGLLLTFLVSKLMFKEKFTLSQYVGFAVGIFSVVLLNL